ncbi:hypothetical protein [Methanobacterium spitsbergense]|uniref:Uncharacterized protein n=1 Tax=Methanobacterium spitsbergense TaxID=2874285 RepID=A0A8T5UNC3_9EURY|nr:hypothetical protein [Methanobacterium spitsbergense]MBZ2165462.1 hypothetical protein [Methanobacterium spitsbergense]
MESQKEQKTFLKMREESDLSLEVVILLIIGVFTLIFGLLLFKIHTGSLPYTADSTYGLFLVIVSFQIVTMGKTPFGDLRRSWLLIIIGIITAIIGMTACFIPGIISEIVRILVGLILFAGGIALILQLYLNEEKAKTWMKNPGILQQLTVSCSLVYILMIILGIITLLPGITTDYLTAVFLIIYSISIFYLAYCLQKITRLYASDKAINPKLDLENSDNNSKSGFKLLADASIPVSIATIIMVGTLITLLGLVLFPVVSGIIPFSTDGELGLLLVLNAIQIMVLGETPLGEFKRSWLMVILGIVFAAFGIFSCIVPGIFTGYIILLIAFLNITGGSILIIKRYLPVVQATRSPSAEVQNIPPIVKKLMVSQTLLNIASIAFGVSMLIPGIIPGMVIAGILVINGLLFFVLASYIQKLMHYGENGKQQSDIS